MAGFSRKVMYNNILVRLCYLYSIISGPRALEITKMKGSHFWVFRVEGCCTAKREKKIIPRLSMEGRADSEPYPELGTLVYRWSTLL